MKAKVHWNNKENYGKKSKILLDEQAITKAIMMRNIWKSDLIQMAIYL